MLAENFFVTFWKALTEAREICFYFYITIPKFCVKWSSNGRIGLVQGTEIKAYFDPLHAVVVDLLIKTLS